MNRGGRRRRNQASGSRGPVWPSSGAVSPFASPGRRSSFENASGLRFRGSEMVLPRPHRCGRVRPRPVSLSVTGCNVVSEEQRPGPKSDDGRPDRRKSATCRGSGGSKGDLAQVRPSPWLRAPVSDLSDTPSLCLPARPTRGRIVVAKHFRGAGTVLSLLCLRKREGSS